MTIEEIRKVTNLWWLTTWTMGVRGWDRDYLCGVSSRRNTRIRDGDSLGLDEWSDLMASSLRNTEMLQRMSYLSALYRPAWNDDRQRNPPLVVSVALKSTERITEVVGCKNRELYDSLSRNRLFLFEIAHLFPCSQFAIPASRHMLPIALLFQLLYANHMCVILYAID